MKKIAKIIFSFLYFLDIISRKLFKKGFLIFFKDFLETRSYTEIQISDNKLKFFTPNETNKWRVDTLFLKEPETLEWIDTFDNNKEFIFWDIGANIGLYSIYASIKHKNVSVVSFEPSTSNLRILSRNVSINKLQDKIKINQLPLTDIENKYQSMNESEFIEGYSMNTFGKSIDFEGKNLDAKNSYKILGTSLNYLIKNNILDFPKYIKIDVDGIEHIVLRGASNFLSDKRIKSILVELNENFSSQYNEVLNIMQTCNFSLKHKKRADKFYSEKHSKVFNYIFEKNEN